MKRHYKYQVLAILFGVIAAACLAAAMLLLSPLQTQFVEDKALRETVSEAVYRNAEGAELEGSSGDGLVHLTVEGTSIDYVVAQATSKSGNTFYLNHDHTGQTNSIGCPFVDYRTLAQAQHALIYAHGNAGTNILFSELKQAYIQDVFDELGRATITYENGMSRSYKPLMALCVNEDYLPIQTFAFADGELTSWLQVLQADASATSDNSAQQIADTKHVLTLVTCSSFFSNQPERTLVIFTCDV